VCNLYSITTWQGCARGMLKGDVHAICKERAPACLICRRQPADRKFDLAVGKLAPVFHDRHVTVGRTFIENLARLKPGCLKRQYDGFVQEDVILPFAEVARTMQPVRDAARLFHCVVPMFRGGLNCLCVVPITQKLISST
jgi:hypothetical protein